MIYSTTTLYIKRNFCSSPCAMIAFVRGKMPTKNLNFFSRLLSSIDSTITLYHCIDARSLRCLWALEELNIKNYQLITMPFPPRIFCKKFLKINPLGTIPFFVDGDVKMTESSGGIYDYHLKPPIKSRIM